MGKRRALLIGITKALLMKGSCVCVCVFSWGCVSVCVTVVSVDPVIKCYGPEGWPDIKALNDAIYYVRCRRVCVVLYCFSASCFFGGGGCGVLSGSMASEQVTKFRGLLIIITVIISLCGQCSEQ